MTFVLGCLVLLGVWAWMHSSADGSGEDAFAFAMTTFDRNEARFRELSDFMDAHPQVGVFARKPLMPAPGSCGICGACGMFGREGSAGEPGYEDDALYMGLETRDVRRMLDLMKRSRVRRIVHHADGTVCMLDLPASFPAAGCVCIVHFVMQNDLPEVQKGTTRTQLREDGWYVVHNLGYPGHEPVETSCGDAWR